MIELFIKLLMGHAIADFALQTDWIAKHKNRNVAPSFIPPGQVPQTTWPYVLSAHSLIHGAMVTIVTGSVMLGCLETAAHWAIDFGKCENWYGIHQDQAAHFICKIAWCFLAGRML